MRTLPRLVGVALLLAASGCASDEHTWVYALSRDFYTDKNFGQSPNWSWPGPNQGSGKEILIVPLVILLPFLIDTAILPVTVTHDLVVAR